LEVAKANVERQLGEIQDRIEHANQTRGQYKHTLKKKNLPAHVLAVVAGPHNVLILLLLTPTGDFSTKQLGAYGANGSVINFDICLASSKDFVVPESLKEHVRKADQLPFSGKPIEVNEKKASPRSAKRQKGEPKVIHSACLHF
jgi:hypothetical protein